MSTGSRSRSADVHHDNRDRNGCVVNWGLFGFFATGALRSFDIRPSLNKYRSVRFDKIVENPQVALPGALLPRVNRSHHA